MRGRGRYLRAEESHWSTCEVRGGESTLAMDRVYLDSVKKVNFLGGMAKGGRKASRMTEMASGGPKYPTTAVSTNW